MTASGAVIVTGDGFQDETSIWVLSGASLATTARFTRQCWAASVSASYAGPTRGRFFVGESATCAAPRVTPYRR